MLSQQRQSEMLQFIEVHRSAAVNQLSDAFGISPSTVRRDLREMAKSGLVNRVHGGAVLSENDIESPIHMRSTEHRLEKQRIGKAAAALVRDDDTIIITSGSTTEAMLPYLAGRQNLTVITNAVNIAYRLGRNPQMNVIVLGGWLRQAEYTLLGHLTRQCLQDLRASKVFHGVYGINARHGLSGTYLPEVQTDRTIFAAADDVIILADSSKFAQTGPVRLAKIADISTVITDDGVAPEAVQRLEAQGVEVQVV